MGGGWGGGGGVAALGLGFPVRRDGGGSEAGSLQRRHAERSGVGFGRTRRFLELRGSERGCKPGRG